MKCNSCGASIAQNSMKCCYCGTVAQGAFTSTHRNNPNQQNIHHVRPTHAVPSSNFGNHFNDNNVNNPNRPHVVNQNNNQNALRTNARRTRMMSTVISLIGVTIFFIIFGTTFLRPYCAREFEVDGFAPTQSQLTGTWNLTATRYRGSNSDSLTPSSSGWRNSYIVFNSDGTFTELNFWNENSILNGTWTLSGHTLTLNRTGGTVGSYAFVSNRRVGIDGNILTITYTRNQGGNTWHYRHTYRRA